MADRLQSYKAHKILEKVDLIELVSEYTKLSPHSLRGKCPLHAGKDDNFSLWPRTNPVAWTCHSSCGSGNAIKFVELKLGYTNDQAIDYLFDKLKLELPSYPKELKAAPDFPYSKRLKDFCTWAHGNINQVESVWRAWGWTEAMVGAWQIGFNPKPLRVDFGQREAIYLARGIVFPHVRSGEYLWANIRRLGNEKPKYLGLAGGRRGLFGVDKWQNHDTLIITEGEKDCISGQFAAGDLCNFACMGGANAKLDAWDSLYLARHARVVTLYDNDKAGNNGAAAMGFEAMHLPSGDLTDFLAAHGRSSTRRMVEGLLFDDALTADDLAWLAEFNQVRATVYPSDRVGKAMAVFMPEKLTPKVNNFQAEQVQLFSIAISGMEYYE